MGQVNSSANGSHPAQVNESFNNSNHSDHSKYRGFDYTPNIGEKTQQIANALTNQELNELRRFSSSNHKGTMSDSQANHLINKITAAAPNDFNEASLIKAVQDIQSNAISLLASREVKLSRENQALVDSLSIAELNFIAKYETSRFHRFETDRHPMSVGIRKKIADIFPDEKSDVLVSQAFNEIRANIYSILALRATRVGWGQIDEGVQEAANVLTREDLSFLSTVDLGNDEYLWYLDPKLSQIKEKINSVLELYYGDNMRLTIQTLQANAIPLLAIKDSELDII